MLKSSLKLQRALLSATLACDTLSNARLRTCKGIVVDS
jgi:hypothetical protein